MICIKTEIPEEICEIDDELKAIYHSQDTICIWVFKSREDRNNFMNDTVGMNKDDREKYFSDNYELISNHCFVKVMTKNNFMLWIFVYGFMFFLLWDWLNR